MKALKITVRIINKYWEKKVLQEYSYSNLSEIPRFTPCLNKECRGGGISILQKVPITDDNILESTYHIPCPGEEIGVSKNETCRNAFIILLEK